VQARRYGALAVARRWAERRGVPLIMLGTESGEQALFRAVDDDELEPGAADALRHAFATDEDIEVVLSRFAPEHLPFVLVPDRDVELKQRIEADDADKRISTAALGLARLFTETIERRPPLRLHLNVECEVVRALGSRLARAPDAPAAMRTLALLRPLVALLSQVDEQQRYMTGEAALRQICELAVTLLDDRQSEGR
jgi:molecular chaperone HtpG